LGKVPRAILAQVGEKVMRKKDLFIKNHILGMEFDRYLMENPEIIDQIPDNAEVFFLPEDDPDLSMENQRLARIQKAEGKSVVLVKIRRLSPIRSRLEDVRLESFSI
jgi:hypothetical protein